MTGWLDFFVYVRTFTTKKISTLAVVPRLIQRPKNSQGLEIGPKWQYFGKSQQGKPTMLTEKFFKKVDHS